MFKFLGNKLFGGPKKQENKPKHRLTISIPSTKYDPPSKHTSKHSSNTSASYRSHSPKPNRSNRTHSPKPKKKPKPKPKSKHIKSKSNIQQLNTSNAIKNGLQQNHHVMDTSRPIFQRSQIFNLNSSLKFEITVQYQQQMWTVYKTLCDFIELYNKLKLKYTNNENIQVPPLLPLGLFYLYFQSETEGEKPSNNKSNKSDKNRKYSPKHVYKQIYQYHQQQIMLQKRQEQQLLQQYERVQHIRMIQAEQQALLQQRQLQQINKDKCKDKNNNTNDMKAPNIIPLGTSNSLPLQSEAEEVRDKQKTTNETMIGLRMNRSIFDSESPFLKHMRVSLQIWLRVIVDDPLLMISSELSMFIQYNITSGRHCDKGGTIEKKDIEKPSTTKGNDINEKDITKEISLSNFTLLKVVGKGAFGKVLQVRRIDNGLIYAMKILKKENVIKRNQIEHTKTERRVLGFVSHPFIVKLYYAFQTETKLFLVLDYCGGGELFFHLGKAGRFKEDRARFYSASIALAIEYLHSKNIIYRDLKPENVLLDSEGHIKLTDFGLSKENINEINLAHSFCGTPEYLAPEILRRCGHGKPADWWSLGALLYEMLTGMPPFYSRDRDRLFEKILHSKLRFPNYFSDSAVNILTLLMQRNWKKRLGSYQSSNPNKYQNDPKKKSFAHLKGAQQIKRHIFFKTIDWNKLYQKKLKPPFIPKLNADQTNNFDQEFTDMPIYSNDIIDKKYKYNREKRKYLLKFQSFTYIRKDSNVSSDKDNDDDISDEDDEEEDESSYEDDDDDESYEDDDSTQDSEQSNNNNNNNNNDNDNDDDGFEVYD